MLNLVKRAPTLAIDLEDQETPGLEIVMETLTDGEAARLSSNRIRTRLTDDGETDVDEAAISMEMPFDDMMALFPKKFVAFEGIEGGVQVEGVPFNVADVSHVAALKLGWKMKAMAKLVSYAMTLPKEMAKNSLAQVKDSPEDTPSSSD